MVYSSCPGKSLVNQSAFEQLNDVDVYNTNAPISRANQGIFDALFGVRQAVKVYPFTLVLITILLKMAATANDKVEITNWPVIKHQIPPINSKLVTKSFLKLFIVNTPARN